MNKSIILSMLLTASLVFGTTYKEDADGYVKDETIIPDHMKTGQAWVLDDSLDVAGAFSCGSITTSYSNEVHVSKSGGDYATITAGIAAAAAMSPSESKKVAVIIHSGTYVEEVTGVANVGLIGIGKPGSVVIETVNGTCYTAPAGNSGCDNIKFYVNSATGISGECLLINSGTHKFNHCAFVADSQTKETSAELVDINGGICEITNSEMIYNFDSSEAVSVPQYLVNESGTSELYLSNVRVDIDIADIDDVSVFYNQSSASTTETHINNCMIHMNMSNAAYSGACGMFYLYGSGTDKNLLGNHGHLTSAGNGTGYMIYQDTSGNNGSVNTSGGDYETSGFALNYFANNGTGDTVVAHNCDIVAANDNTGVGTVTGTYSDANGDFIITNFLDVSGSVECTAMHFTDTGTPEASDYNTTNEIRAGADGSNYFLYIGYGASAGWGRITAEVGY